MYQNSIQQFVPQFCYANAHDLNKQAYAVPGGVPAAANPSQAAMYQNSGGIQQPYFNQSSMRPSGYQISQPQPSQGLYTQQQMMFMPPSQYSSTAQIIMPMADTNYPQRMSSPAYQNSMPTSQGLFQLPQENTANFTPHAHTHTYNNPPVVFYNAAQQQNRPPSVSGMSGQGPPPAKKRERTVFQIIDPNSGKDIMQDLQQARGTPPSCSTLGSHSTSTSDQEHTKSKASTHISENEDQDQNNRKAKTSHKMLTTMGLQSHHMETEVSWLRSSSEEDELKSKNKAQDASLAAKVEKNEKPNAVHAFKRKKDGKKRYDRVFLLKLQNSPQSMMKPADLPDIPDIIIEKPGFQLFPRDFADVGNIADFTTGYKWTVQSQSRNSYQGKDASWRGLNLEKNIGFSMQKDTSLHPVDGPRKFPRVDEEPKKKPSKSDDSTLKAKTENQKQKTTKAKTLDKKAGTVGKQSTQVDGEKNWSSTSLEVHVTKLDNQAQVASHTEKTKKNKKQKAVLKSKEDQCSPIIPEVKKRYDRVFLLKLQNAAQSMIKPAGLPDIPEIMIEKPNFQLLPRDVTDVGNIAHFTTGYIWTVKSQLIDSGYIKPTLGGGTGQLGLYRGSIEDGSRSKEGDRTHLSINRFAALSKAHKTDDKDSHRDGWRGFGRPGPQVTCASEESEREKSTKAAKTVVAERQSHKTTYRHEPEHAKTMEKPTTPFLDHVTNQMESKNHAIADIYLHIQNATLGDGEKIRLGPQGGATRLDWFKGCTTGNRFSALSRADKSEDDVNHRRGGQDGFGQPAQPPANCPSQESQTEKDIAAAKTVVAHRLSEEWSGRHESEHDKTMEKPSTPVLQLTEDQIRSKTCAIMDEYLHKQDVEEAISCVQELSSSGSLHLFVYHALNQALERSEVARRQTGLLLHYLVKNNVLLVHTYVRGLNQIMMFAEDMEINIPKIWEFLGQLISPMVQDDSVPLGFLKQVCEPLRANSKSGILIAEILHDASHREEVISCVQELSSSGSLHLFVYHALNQVLERSEFSQWQTGLLLHDLVKNNVLLADTYVRGLNEILMHAEDMEIKIPKVWESLGHLICPMVQDGSMPLSFLKQVCEPLRAHGKSGILIAEILHNASHREGHKKVARLWAESGLHWSDFVPNDQIDQFLTDMKLEFIKVLTNLSTSMSITDIKESLHSLILSCSNEEVFDWIEGHVDKSMTKDKDFIQALMSAVCSSAIAVDGINMMKVDKSQIQRRNNLLQKYLDHQVDFELQALYALQALVHKLEHPSGVLRELFDILYDEDIISEDAFIQWEKSEDPQEQEGKSMALKQVVQFFNWLKESEDEVQSSNQGKDGSLWYISQNKVENMAIQNDINLIQVEDDSKNSPQEQEKEGAEEEKRKEELQKIEPQNSHQDNGGSGQSRKQENNEILSIQNDTNLNHVEDDARRSTWEEAEGDEVEVEEEEDQNNELLGSHQDNDGPGQSIIQDNDGPGQSIIQDNDGPGQSIIQEINESLLIQKNLSLNQAEDDARKSPKEENDDNGQDERKEQKNETSYPSQSSIQPPSNPRQPSIQPPSYPRQPSIQPPSNPSQSSIQPPSNPRQPSIQPPSNPRQPNIQPPSYPSQPSIQPPNFLSQTSMQSPSYPSQPSMQTPSYPSQTSMQPPSYPVVYPLPGQGMYTSPQPMITPQHMLSMPQSHYSSTGTHVRMPLSGYSNHMDMPPTSYLMGQALQVYAAPQQMTTSPQQQRITPQHQHMTTPQHHQMTAQQDQNMTTPQQQQMTTPQQTMFMPQAQYISVGTQVKMPMNKCLPRKDDNNQPSDQIYRKVEIQEEQNHILMLPDLPLDKTQEEDTSVEGLDEQSVQSHLSGDNVQRVIQSQERSCSRRSSVKSLEWDVMQLEKEKLKLEIEFIKVKYKKVIEETEVLKLQKELLKLQINRFS